MNLQCPSCQAEYAVPEAALSTRHIVRCSACDHSWTIGDADPDEDGADPESAAGTEDEEPDSGEPIEDASDAAAEPALIARLAPPLSPRPTPKRWLAAAWMASLSAIAACVVAACLYQSRVVAVWPPAGHLFAANHATIAEPAKAPRPDGMIRAERSKP